MTTATQAISAVFSIIWASSLKTEISGSVRRYSRMINSEKEDIVINSLPIDFDQLQSGVLNVNIHVPNPKYTTIIDGKTQTLQDLPNEARLNTLCNMFSGLFATPYYNDGVYIEMQQQLVLAGEDSKSTFINNRLNIRAKNL